MINFKLVYKVIGSLLFIEAAMLAVFHSSQSASAKVPVDYTPVKYVKKPAGARPGMVIYSTCRTVNVTPEEALVKKLLGV